MPRSVYKRKIRPAIERFIEKIVKSESGCWKWIGAISGTGYGSFYSGQYGARYDSAHRCSYEFYVSKIPEGMVIDHLCRNRWCVNPEHLECVTMRENTDRGVLYETLTANAKKKTHCKRGHELFGRNLIIDRKGDRCCKTCQRTKAEEWRIKNRERVNYMQQLRRAAIK